MVDKTNLNDLSRNFATGRASSSAYALDVIKKFYEGPVRTIYASNMSEKDACDSMHALLDELQVDGLVKSYGKTIAYYWKRNNGLPIRSDLITCLAFPACGIIYRKYLHPFYYLPLRDYLEALGRNDLYEKWFMQDAEAWERDHGGQHPALYDVLDKVFNATEFMPENVTPYKSDERVPLYTTDHIYEAFRRRTQNKKDFREGVLVATWMNILFMEAPLGYQHSRTYEKLNSSEQYIEFEKKGCKEDEKNENF